MRHRPLNLWKLLGITVLVIIGSAIILFVMDKVFVEDSSAPRIMNRK